MAVIKFLIPFCFLFLFNPSYSQIHKLDDYTFFIQGEVPDQPVDSLYNSGKGFLITRFGLGVESSFHLWNEHHGRECWKEDSINNTLFARFSFLLEFSDEKFHVYWEMTCFFGDGKFKALLKNPVVLLNESDVNKVGFSAAPKKPLKDILKARPDKAPEILEAYHKGVNELLFSFEEWMLVTGSEFKVRYFDPKYIIRYRK